MRRLLRWAAVALFSLSAIWCAGGAAFARQAPFGARRDLAVDFAGAHSTFAVDIDGDGDLDVLGAGREADEVRWWENAAGDGSAWTEHIIATGIDGARVVYGADLDQDGDADVAGAAGVTGDIIWWENTIGDGSSWSAHTVGTSAGAIDVVAADLDADGDPDLVSAAETAKEVVWWENTAGDGSAWTGHLIAGSLNAVQSARVADVDGDGDGDVLAAVSGSDTIVWQENTAGDASAWTAHVVTSSFASAASADAADLDGDGDLDVVGAASGDDTIAWWDNTAGDGSAWTLHTVDASFAGAWRVRAADLDSDGDADLLGAARDADDLVWWENTAGDGSNWNRRDVVVDFTGARDAMAADLDRDGDLDVLGAAWEAGQIAWWKNEMIHRSAVFPARDTVATSYGRAHSVHAADVDGDGDIDMLGAAYNDNRVDWWENTAGDGSAWTAHEVNSAFNQASAVYAVDMDADGDIDVLGAAESARVVWWENTAGNGLAWTEHALDTWFWGASSVYPADIDGDGDLDAAGAGYGADDVAWWENTAGDGSAWTKHALQEDLDGARTVVVADVDGDGDEDIAAAAYFADQVLWWENTAGDGSAWSEQTVDASVDGAYSVRAGDADGDGDLDLFGAAKDAGEIIWWENAAGDGSIWTRHRIGASFADAHSIHVTDMDADGDIDLVGAAWSPDDVAWWENVAGDGSVWTQHIVDGDFDGATSVYAFDVDGDGDADVLGAAYWGEEMAWWENRGGQFALATTDTAPLSIPANDLDDVLAVTMTHRGRAGDRDEELVSLSLRFVESVGDPLTSAEANAMIDELRIYVDDGSGVFEPALDTLVATVDDLVLTDGAQIVTFSDSDSGVQVALGAPRTYFVAPALAMYAHQATPHQFGVTHQSETGGTAEDRVDDLPLEPEFAANVSSEIVQIVTEADLRIVKAVTPARLGPGDQITYTLTYSSTGPSPADSVIITDVVPYTVTNPAYISSGAVITPTGGSDYVWDVGELLPMAGGTITITGVIEPAATGDTTLTNRATIGSATTDPAGGNNENSATNTVDAEPPVRPILRAPDDDVRTADNTPRLVWYRSISPDTAGYLLDAAGSVRDVGNESSRTLEVLADGVYTWTLAAYDDLGNTSTYTDSWSFTVDTTPPAQVDLISPPHELYTSTTSFNLQWGASGSSDVAGYMLSLNGAAGDQGNVTTYPTGILADDVYTWTVAAYDDLANLSAYTDTWSLTVDTIPPDAPALLSPDAREWTSDTTPTLMWDDSPSDDTVGYLLDFDGSISDVGNVTQITLLPLASGVYTWTVAARDPADNVGSYAEPRWFVVNPTAPLIVEKTDERDPLPAGWILRYRIQVRNTMPSVVSGVIVTDTLPPETRVSEVDAGGQQVGRDVVWDLGDMAPGESRELHLSLGMYTTLRGVLTNQVVADGRLSVFAVFRAGDDETTEIVDPPNATATPTATESPPTPTATPIPTVVRLRQGVDGYAGSGDAYLDLMHGDANYGNASRLYLKTEDNAAVVTRFDLSGWASTAAEEDRDLVSAWLRLHLESTAPANEPITLRAYRLLRPWVEGEASWTYASAGVLWAAAGANGEGVDRSALPVAQLECYEPAADDGWIALDLTDAAAYWLEHPTENFGVVVKAYRCGHTVLYGVSSSEATELSTRPEMALGYLPLEPVGVETPAATPTPTGTPNASPTAMATPTDTATPVPTPATAGSIQGLVWLDIVRNGVWQAGEPGLAGATVSLYRDGALVDDQTTPADGQYVFVALDPGEYVVVETDPPGHGSTTTNNRLVSVLAGESTVADFGDYLMDTPTPTGTPAATAPASSSRVGRGCRWFGSRSDVHHQWKIASVLTQYGIGARRSR